MRAALRRPPLVAGKLAAGPLLYPLTPLLATEETFHLVWPTNAALSRDAERFVVWLLNEAAEAGGSSEVPS
jgi:DNA-binding transcriptional LysR family regulator